MTQSLFESFGALDLPADEADVGDTLAHLDPARDKMLALFAAALRAELGAAFQKATRTRLPAGHPLYDKSIVVDTLPQEPSPSAMKERVAGFPLLALHRTGQGQFENATMNGTTRRRIQPWDLHLILGTLDTAQIRQLGDICISATTVIDRCIERRGHPAFEGGALQFFPELVTPDAPDEPYVPLFPAKSYLGAAEATGYDGPGPAAFAGDEKSTLYYAITIHLRTAEHSTEQDVDETVDGADFSIGLANADDGDTIADFVEAVTDPDIEYQPQ